MQLHHKTLAFISVFVKFVTLSRIKSHFESCISNKTSSPPLKTPRCLHYTPAFLHCSSLYSPFLTPTYSTMDLLTALKIRWTSKRQLILAKIIIKIFFSSFMPGI